MPRPEWLPDDWHWWMRRELAVLRPDCIGHEERVPSIYAAAKHNEDGGWERRVNWCLDRRCEDRAKAAICGGDDGE